MNKPLRTYTERRAFIAHRLESHFPISTMTSTNLRPNSADAEEFFGHSFLATWADHETGRTRTVTVSIEEARDGEAEAADVREMLRDECEPGVDLDSPNSEAYEIHLEHAHEHAFALEYLGRVTAIVGNCIIHIIPRGIDIELNSLVNAALDIGRNVGCSAYENDFTAPEFSAGWAAQQAGWTVEGQPPYIPGLSEPESQ